MEVFNLDDVVIVSLLEFIQLSWLDQLDWQKFQQLVISFLNFELRRFWFHSSILGLQWHSILPISLYQFILRFWKQLLGIHLMDEVHYFYCVYNSFFFLFLFRILFFLYVFLIIPILQIQMSQKIHYMIQNIHHYH